MGWSYGVLNDGREVGYGVEATCEHPGCTEQIDRGMAYACGGADAVLGRSEVGCGHHFCAKHLFMGGPNQMCQACSDAWEAEHPEWGCGKSLLDVNEVWIACGTAGELCDDCLAKCKGPSNVRSGNDGC